MLQKYLYKTRVAVQGKLNKQPGESIGLGDVFMFPTGDAGEACCCCHNHHLSTLPQLEGNEASMQGQSIVLITFNLVLLM